MKRLFHALCIAFILAAVCCAEAFAAEITISQTNIQTGKTGRTMTVTFQYTAYDDDPENMYYGGIYCGDGYDTSDIPDDEVSNVFPFETPSSSNVSVKIGSLKKGTHTVSVSMKVRRDIKAGYYSVPVFVSTDEQSGAMAWVKVYIQEAKASESSPDDSVERVSFELGEGQATPYGVYPSVVNFTLNLRNSGTISAQNVKASIVCAKSSEEFPFDINEANYDRQFELIGSGETVELPYSFAIRQDCYSGFYPIKMNVTYRESSGGELKKAELSFFVHIKNKEKADEAREFNANDRVRARIVVDSYRTEPEEVYAGTPFDLFLTMKNASANIEASNILFTLESEKTSDSPVFSPVNGSNSVVIGKLAGNESAEIKMSFTSAASVDPKSYGINIIEKYDSPEFKNAEEKLSIVIPLKQMSRFNMGTVELLPSEVNVGEEINVMFPVNNTGKTLLYNCTVRFSDDTISDAEVYLGNIKPGESGKVDTMLKTVAPTTDDGKVKVIISYEDEFGEVTETEKSISVPVNEVISDFPDDDFVFPEPVEEKTPWYKSLWLYGGVAAALIAAIVIIRIRKKKKAESL